MRILFINQYYAPDFAATAQQLSDLCERMAAAGHEVHVLTSQAIYDGRSLDLPAEEVLNGVHVHRVGLSQNSRDRLRQRLMGYLSFYLQAFLRVHSLPRPDVVVTLTTPPMISLLGAWMKMLYGTRFVYWVMDVYPDIALKAGVLTPMGPIRALWSAVGRISYRTADRIVVLGEDMRSVIRRKVASARHDRINVVHCWSSSEEVHPVPKAENAFRRTHLNPDAFCLMYSGNMGTCHEFKGAIGGIKALADRKDIHFSFVGGGKQLPKLKKELAKTANVAFLPYQDRTVLSESLSAPDAHLVTLQSRFDGLLVPSKIYGIMAAGRAVLFVGSQQNEIARIINKAHCGMVIPPEDPEAFRQAVNWMTENPEEVIAMGQRGHRYFQRNFETDVLAPRFIRLLEQTADRHAPVEKEVGLLPPGSEPEVGLR